MKNILPVLLILLIAACDQQHQNASSQHVEKDLVKHVQLGNDSFLIPIEYVGERYQDGENLKDINVTLLLRAYGGVFIKKELQQRDINQIDVMWSRRGDSVGYDAALKLKNLLKFMDIKRVAENENVSEYYSAFSDKKLLFYQLEDGNEMLVDCPVSESKFMCRNFYFDKNERTGGFFAFHKKHLQNVEAIYMNINALIKEWRQ